MLCQQGFFEGSNSKFTVEQHPQEARGLDSFEEMSRTAAAAGSSELASSTEGTFESFGLLACRASSSSFDE